MQGTRSPHPWSPNLHLGSQEAVNAARSIYRKAIDVSSDTPAKRFTFKAGLPFDEIRFPGLSGDNP